MNTNSQPQLKAQTGAQPLVPIIVASIYEIAGRFRDQGEAIARTVGHTQARWQVLSAASGRPAIPCRRSRACWALPGRTCSGSPILVEEGAAEYRDNPDHRGSPHLILTKRGHAALETITRAASGYHARLARDFPPSDVVSLQRGLRRLLEALTDIEPVNPK